MKKYKGSGWFNESVRHGLSAKGVKTGRKSTIISTGLSKSIAGMNYARIPSLTLSGGRLSDFDKVKQYRIWVHPKTGDDYYYTFKNEAELKQVREQIKKDNPLYVEKPIAVVWDKKNKKYREVVIDYARPTHPQHILQAPLPDQDKDGVPDSVDWDDDNDGVPDWKDNEGAFNIDRYAGQGVFDPFYESPKDSDLDGIPDVKDLHPQNPFKSGDWAKISEETKRKISLGKLSEKTKKQLRKIEKEQLRDTGDYAKLNRTKPYIVGQQLRIPLKPLKHDSIIRVHDIGVKGRLQRIAEDVDGWQTRSWHLNLKDYKDLKDVVKEINSLRISKTYKANAIIKAQEYFYSRG